MRVRKNIEVNAYFERFTKITLHGTVFISMHLLDLIRTVRMLNLTHFRHESQGQQQLVL